MRHNLLAWRLLLLFFVATPAALYSAPAAATSLRFYGNGVDDIDRVKIRVSDPQTPADLGAGDFTIEFWMKARPEDYIPQRNEDGTLTNNPCTRNGNSWINGNIIFDRALFDNASFGAFGISMFQSGIAFGVTRDSPPEDGGLCGSVPVNDGQWHHIAVTRDGSSGTISLFIDGVLDQREFAPGGDVSYDDDRTLSSSPPVPQGVDIPNVEPFLVIGAEKYSLGDRYPSFSGWIDEVRLSDVVRYMTNFSPSTQPFAADLDTVALYHFDEAGGADIVDVLGTSPGVRRFGTGGVRPAGPEWSTDSPFGSAPNPGILQFSQTAFSVGEGTGPASITVTRSGGSAGAVSVTYATEDGTALVGPDYTFATGTLSWNDGETGSRTFTVAVTDDGSAEPNETVNLLLRDPAGGAGLGRSTAVLTIVDDDGPDTFSFGEPNYTASESAGTVTLTVFRSGAAAGTASVNYMTDDGTALAGADYVFAAGTLTFDPGVSSQTITVSIINDTDVEGNEAVDVVLDSPAGAVLGAPSTAVVTIADDDTGNPGGSASAVGGGGCVARLSARADLDLTFYLLLVIGFLYRSYGRARYRRAGHTKRENS